MKQFILFLVFFPSLILAQSIGVDSSCLCGRIELPKTKEGYFVVEDAPSYPGGSAAFKSLLINNCKFDSGDNGKIFVSFFVSCRGNTCGFKVTKKEGEISKSSENELINELGKMEKWIPAKNRGEVVDVQFQKIIELTNGKVK